MVAEVSESPDDYPSSDTAVIYRWASGSWKEQGAVDHVGANPDMFGDDGWLAAVGVPGTADPAFVPSGTTGSVGARTMALTDVGGKWHTAMVTVPSAAP